MKRATERKKIIKKKTTRKRNIKVNLDKWELGDWPERVMVHFQKTLRKSLTVHVETFMDEFEMGGIADNIVRSIGEEVIETFLSGGSTSISITPNGVEILADDVKKPKSHPIEISWDDIWIKQTQTLDVLRTFLLEIADGLHVVGKMDDEELESLLLNDSVLGILRQIRSAGDPQQGE